VVFDCEISCVLDYEWIRTGHQLCSIVYKCHIISLTPKLNVQIAGVDVEETCYVGVLETHSNELLTKELVVQGR